MLCLTRRLGEEIYIGKDIVIRVEDISGRGSVRIRVTAPQNVVVLRGELVSEAHKQRLREEVTDKKSKYHDKKLADFAEGI